MIDGGVTGCQNKDVIQTQAGLPPSASQLCSPDARFELLALDTRLANHAREREKATKGASIGFGTVR
jgi:hypothetical protein